MNARIDINAHVGSIAEMTRIVQGNAHLITVLTKRELTEAFAGQIFARFWAIGHPLFLMALYAVIFSVVFNARVGGTHELPLDYTVYILSGLVPWLTFQQAMTKGCLAITANDSIVKQIVFPMEVLPIKSALAALAVMFIGMLFVVAYTVLVAHTIYATYLLIPILLLLQTIAMVGVCFAVSSTSVFVRDIKEFIQLFSVANIFFMPIIYLPEWVPSVFKPVIYVNPFSYLVWCFQDVFYFGRIEHPYAWLLLCIMSTFVLLYGYRVFRTLKPYFGNVL